jgi:hypothetical protein
MNPPVGPALLEQIGDRRKIDQAQPAFIVRNVPPMRVAEEIGLDVPARAQNLQQLRRVLQRPLTRPRRPDGIVMDGDERGFVRVLIQRAGQPRPLRVAQPAGRRERFDQRIEHKPIGVTGPHDGRLAFGQARVRCFLLRQRGPEMLAMIMIAQRQMNRQPVLAHGPEQSENGRVIRRLPAVIGQIAIDQHAGDRFRPREHLLRHRLQIPGHIDIAVDQCWGPPRCEYPTAKPNYFRRRRICAWRTRPRP